MVHIPFRVGAGRSSQDTQGGGGGITMRFRGAAGGGGVGGKDKCVIILALARGFEFNLSEGALKSHSSPPGSSRPAGRTGEGG